MTLPMNDIKDIVDGDGNVVDRIPVSTGDAPSLDSVDPLVGDLNVRIGVADSQAAGENNVGNIAKAAFHQGRAAGLREAQALIANDPLHVPPGSAKRGKEVT